MDTTPAQAAKVTLSLFGQTREVEIQPVLFTRGGGCAQVPGFVASIGAGSARYPVKLTLNLLEEGGHEPRGTTKVTDSAGRAWTYTLRAGIRNRVVQISGWADVAGVTNRRDQTKA